MTTASIYQRMSAVMADVGPVAKNGRNEAQRFNFRSIDDTVQAVHVALVKHEVTVLPNVLHIETSQVQTSTGKTSNQTVVTVEYTFAAPDGSTVRTVMAGEAMDAGDKATSKALSMAFKYLLFQTFTIPTGERDADADVHEVAPTPAKLTEKHKTAIRQAGAAAGVEGPALKDKISEILGRDVDGFHAMSVQDAETVLAQLTTEKGSAA